MNIFSRSQIKDEPADETPPNVMPAQGLLEFFLNNDYRRSDVEYYYSQMKCLDETDGKFKFPNDLCTNAVKPTLTGDFKNQCNTCEKQFDNFLAAQSHYIFNHPCESMLTRRIASDAYNSANKKINYNWLDETDGKFKFPNDLCTNTVKPTLTGDFKNQCNTCEKQFDNFLAAQSHYIFNHPCESMLTTRIASDAYNSANKKINYNWLDEPELGQPIPKNYGVSSNIIIIKNKEEYLQKVSSTEKLVHVTEVQTPNNGFTLEDIKVCPQEGIRVVKKSEIKFDELRWQAEQKIELSKKPELRRGEAPSKKLHEPERQLMKIDINDAFKARPKRDTALFTRELLAVLQKPQKKDVKYLCRRCNLEMFDPYVFDAHMCQHINATFTCPFCTKTFCTKIGIANHTETCKDSANAIVKIAPLPKKT